MNAAALSELANDVGLKLDETAAHRLLRKHGLAAQDLVVAAGTLTDLGAAVGIELEPGAAIDRISEADLVYELAADRLLEPIRRRKQRIFSTAYDRLERAFFGNEAKARHAVFVGELIGGRLGWQTSMLLRAAEDAQLADPDSARYAKKLDAIISEEILRRYPQRRDAEWEVVDPDSAVTALRDRARSDETQAKEMVLKPIPTLAQRIEALATGRSRKDIEAVLDQIRKRLADRAGQGWIARPEQYREEVLEPAAEAARRAS